MRLRGLHAAGAIATVILITSCATPGPSSSEPSGPLTEIPAVPAGFSPLPSISTGFRSAKVEHPNGTWVVTFHDAIIKVAPLPFNVTKMEPSWYPEEGGADAALCRGYINGNQTLLTFEGSSDFVTEQTWLLFEGIKLKEAVKYSLPGMGMGPDAPGKVVPPSERVKRQSFLES